MNNYLILLAGGVGNRMGVSVPKQFIEIKGKPIIVYTLEKFQINDKVKKILIVCVKEWMEHLKQLIKKTNKKIAIIFTPIIDADDAIVNLDSFSIFDNTSLSSFNFLTLILHIKSKIK